VTDPSAPAHRLRRFAGRTGWALLVLVSFCVTYAVLVVGGH
jgi:hypothetical protein